MARSHRTEQLFSSVHEQPAGQERAQAQGASAGGIRRKETVGQQNSFRGSQMRNLALIKKIMATMNPLSELAKGGLDLPVEWLPTNISSHLFHISVSL